MIDTPIRPESSSVADEIFDGDVDDSSHHDQRKQKPVFRKPQPSESPCKSCVVMLFLQGDRATNYFQTE
jgi:hypothetical protein